MPLFFSSPISMAGTAHGPAHRGLRCCQHALQCAWHDGVTVWRILHQARHALTGSGDYVAGHRPAGHGARCAGRLATAMIGLVIVLSAPIPARAAHGFSGLDNDTLETLRRSDQRPKHDAAGPGGGAQDMRRHGAPTVSSSEAARIAREREGGKVLNVVLEHGPSGPYYRVKILEHGRVQEVHVDAR